MSDIIWYPQDNVLGWEANYVAAWAEDRYLCRFADILHWDVQRFKSWSFMEIEWEDEDGFHDMIEDLPMWWVLTV